MNYSLAANIYAHNSNIALLRTLGEASTSTRQPSEYYA